jgi:alkanesulfonate monooxygenase SsuD/methylene tetrahydromethanopterin reductase-like flavin-dependent oxidoreductase (luciferase family)
VKLGLSVADFTWPAGPSKLGQEMAEVVRTADDVGFAYISVMDHSWQIPVIGPKEHDMLESYTALGFIAAHTTRARLLTLVTGVSYREPGLLAKAISTLDVMSGGRAALGIGAGWNEDESLGLGFGFPPTSERFERLEECLQICLQMWSDNDGPYQGKHYQLRSTLNQPQPANARR